MDTCWTRLEFYSASQSPSLHPRRSLYFTFHSSKLSTPGNSCISPPLLSPLTDSSQESESLINVIAMSCARCVSYCKPTLHTAPSSCVLVCLCMCPHVTFLSLLSCNLSPKLSLVFGRTMVHYVFTRPLIKFAVAHSHTLLLWRVHLMPD